MPNAHTYVKVPAAGIVIIKISPIHPSKARVPTSLILDALHLLQVLQVLQVLSQHKLAPLAGILPTQYDGRQKVDQSYLGWG